MGVFNDVSQRFFLLMPKSRVTCGDLSEKKTEDSSYDLL
jgi:hypothetical protein